MWGAKAGQGKGLSASAADRWAETRYLDLLLFPHIIVLFDGGL
jgi:hypothetical protein